MARAYKVPADVSEKEKIVGGLFTAEQAAWLALGFITTAGLFILFVKIMPAALAFILALPVGIAIGVPFAFWHKHGLCLKDYLLLNHRFKKKNKRLYNTLTYGKTGKNFFD